MKEKEIISRCLKGEMEAFEMLVKKYESNILSFALNVLGDKEEAKDIVQETFIKAYFSLDRYDATKNFKTWLYTIAYRKCIDKLRKERNFKNFFRKAIQKRKEDFNEKNIETKIEESEIFSILLSYLNEKERTAITLKINEGYSAKEIADVLNCAESTARVHLFNARRKLKKLLEEKNV